MKKKILLAIVAVQLLATFSPALAADPAGSSDNKVVGAAKAVGRGIMWGPKKLAEGAKAAGSKIKDMFHR